MRALPQFHNREQSFIQSKNTTVCTNYDWPTIGPYIFCTITYNHLAMSCNVV